MVVAELKFTYNRSNFALFKLQEKFVWVVLDTGKIRSFIDQNSYMLGLLKSGALLPKVFSKGGVLQC